MRGFPKGSRCNLKSFVIARLPEGKPCQSSPSVIASLPKGSPTPSVIASPPPAGVAISNPSSLRGSRREAVSISPAVIASSQRAILHPLSLRARLRRAWQSQYEIASLPLAMTVREIVIARLPKGKPWQSLFKSKSKINS